MDRVPTTKGGRGGGRKGGGEHVEGNGIGETNTCLEAREGTREHGVTDDTIGFRERALCSYIDKYISWIQLQSPTAVVPVHKVRLH